MLRGRHRSQFLLAAVVLALVVGIGVGAWLTSASPTAITLAGSETNISTGVAISVSVVSHGTTSHVDATVKGLHAGVQYALYVVNVHGQTQVVARWVASDLPYAYHGDDAVPAVDIAFFTVTGPDGEVVITVRVARSG